MIEIRFFNPLRLAKFRNLIMVYAGFVFLQVIHHYATANLPRKRGGRWDNPLNDPFGFCCVYGHPPCVGGHRAACMMNDQSRLLESRDLRTFGYSALFYLAHGAVFVVASASVWGPYTWWLFNGGGGDDNAWGVCEQYTTAAAFVLQAWLLFVRFRLGFPPIQVF
jgi:hypothetical protein